MNEQDRREAVRRRYRERCGYCSVHESEAGNELEIDHVQPRSAGGADGLDNLVYCCPACNRLKGDYWPVTDPYTTPQRLLHPLRDNVLQHMREEPDSRLTALTTTGTFHIARLRLNRPPLVARRRARREVARLRENLEAAAAEQARLRDRITALDQDMEEVLAQLSRTSSE